jgi:hypothetical protein
MSRPGARLRLTRGASGPGPGAGGDRDPERTAADVSRIALVATVVIGQLWGLTVALNAYFEGEIATVWWLVAFEGLSFLVALGMWLLAPGDR